MENIIYKAVRIPRQLDERIRRALKMDGDTFSQFIRKAALRELQKREKEAA